MSKLYLFTFLFVLIASGLKAQDVTFGLKLGVNIANVSSDFSQTQGQTYFHLGGLMHARYSDKIALQTEILYSEQGFSFTDANSETTFKLSYINVPVLVKYYLIKDLYVEAGPQIGFLNTARLFLKTDERASNQNIKDGLRDNDLSLSLGTGYVIDNNFSIGVRYNLGLTNFLNREPYPNLKNKVFQFSIGYIF